MYNKRKFIQKLSIIMKENAIYHLVKVQTLLILQNFQIFYLAKT